MSKAKCALWDQIDHSKVKPIYIEQMFYCSALAKNSDSMNQTQVICSHCCIRLSQIIERRKDLILRRELSADDMKRGDGWIEYLLPEHQTYAKLIPKLTGKSFEEIEGECVKCNAEPVEVMQTRYEEATPMEAVGHRDLL